MGDDDPAEDNGEASDVFDGEAPRKDVENVFEDLQSIDETETPAEEVDDLFESVETTDLDEEAIWESVLSADDDDPIGADPAEAGVDAVVSKSQYCMRCEFFSAPPDVACNHPGTEIETLVGIDQFRVTNCPVVARRGHGQAVFEDDE